MRPNVVEYNPTWSLSNPITAGDKFVCEGCCCGEVVLYYDAFVDGKIAALCTCPHIDIWLRDGKLLAANTKGVRH